MLKFRTKLAVGLLSGKYSVPSPKGSPVDADSPGISPHMFKALIGRGHPDFSTKRQQDAQEFMCHIITLIERNSRGKLDPTKSFKFKLEERVQCSSSKKVKYTYRTDWLLPLNIPLEAAINKDEVAAYEVKRAEAESQGKKLDPDALVRPKIRLFSCLEAFTQSEIIEQFFSTAVGAKTTARKYVNLFYLLFINNNKSIKTKLIEEFQSSRKCLCIYHIFIMIFTHSNHKNKSLFR